MDNWYLYMIRCRDNSLYTGIAIDVARRLTEHQSGKGAKYLRGRSPLKLVFETRVGSRGEALKIEQRVKKLPKHKKEALVRSNGDVNPMLFSLKNA
ncbi:MAG: GIY-YIG nuclease family protein [Desulfobacterales bacterium]|nr:GIY-YIG nuclease family protein [Desulfobacterales bacterium]